MMFYCTAEHEGAVKQCTGEHGMYLLNLIFKQSILQIVREEVQREEVQTY